VRSNPAEREPILGRYEVVVELSERALVQSLDAISEGVFVGRTLVKSACKYASDFDQLCRRIIEHDRFDMWPLLQARAHE